MSTLATLVKANMVSPIEIPNPMVFAVKNSNTNYTFIYYLFLLTTNPSATRPSISDIFWAPSPPPQQNGVITISYPNGAPVVANPNALIYTLFTASITYTFQPVGNIQIAINYDDSIPAFDGGKGLTQPRGTVVTVSTIGGDDGGE